ncbi:hypothetical protein [Polaribacter sp. Z022]|uniref:hypothetical protein n=1 Tax=Polaribacter sp. Z022 TaxID=2927125 RepID=UPI002021E867|nr:hypothetical protein [Polaribacter sp. Z022]MCL7753444.1 hypothetical protein [Polaribacter sp. Z022]
MLKKKMMKSYTKKTLKTGVFTGIAYAIATAGLNYYDGDEFEIWKIIFQTLFFTFFMNLFFYYKFKKEFDKNNPVKNE